jgi:hypothetical protein
MAWIISTRQGANGGIHSQLLAKMPPKNFLEHIDATKTSSFSLQGTNRAAPVGDDES